MLVVIALGGNALLRRGEPLDAAVQRANIKVAVDAITELARTNRVVITHGNGPQVGLLSLQNEAYSGARPYPLDVLGAESEGMIGYLLEQELGRHVPRERLATLLTQVVVDADDPAFRQPTKFIGPIYSDVDELATERGRVMRRDGDAWRRVVPSPEPRRIVELEAIRLLVEHDVIVTCVGGGGIPVVTDATGGMWGIEAVIDKDLAAALLARELGADALLLLTDTDAVYTRWGTPAAMPISTTTASALRALHLPKGSMGPKAEAACRFVEAGGQLAAIGRLEDAAAMLRSEAGTIVRGEPT